MQSEFEKAMPVLMLAWPDVMNSDPLYGSQMLYAAERLCRTLPAFDGHKVIMLGTMNKLTRPATVTQRAEADFAYVLEAIGWIKRVEPPCHGRVAKWKSLLFLP